MSNVNVYLRENLGLISSGCTYVAPQIEEKKLNNAIKAFGYGGSPNSVIAIYDNALVFKNAKEGILFTGEQMIYRPDFGDPKAILYSEISCVEYKETMTGKNNDNLVKSIELSIINGEVVVLKSLINCNHSKLVEILKNIISNFDEFKEEKQLVAIEEMSEDVKVTYLQSTINMAYDNDGVIDDKEFAEILLLMTRVELKPESRFLLRNYMESADDLTPLDILIEKMDSACPVGQIKSVHISLVKDLVNLFFSTGGGEIEDFVFLKKNRSLLKVTDDEIELAVMAIRNDHNMLKEDVTDDQIVAAMKSLSAKAAAVGTPLAAVYLSGSVIGMSAAGITSGLATLGMGGILGLSSMATGIGVAVLIGVGAYAGIRKFTGVNEISRSKRRELMLNEVIKQTEKTISLLIQDINYISVKLNCCFPSNIDPGFSSKIDPPSGLAI